MFAGQYLYTEASFPAQKGMVARFKSPAIIQFGSSEKCLQLWYNLNGDRIGTLRLLLNDIFTGTEKQIWEVSGNKGDKWIELRTTLRSSNPFRVRSFLCEKGLFEGIKIEILSAFGMAGRVDYW